LTQPFRQSSSLATRHKVDYLVLFQVHRYCAVLAASPQSEFIDAQRPFIPPVVCSAAGARSRMRLIKLEALTCNRACLPVWPRVLQPRRAPAGFDADSGARCCGHISHAFRQSFTKMVRERRPAFHKRICACEVEGIRKTPRSVDRVDAAGKSYGPSVSVDRIR
jgi:hypothetical protein